MVHFLKSYELTKKKTYLNTCFKTLITIMQVKYADNEI
jgi:hypothetical protein